MKTIWFGTTLVFLACVLGALDGFGQGEVDPALKIKVGPSELPVPTRVIHETKVALPSVDGDVKSLVQHFGLNQKPRKNPDLVFTDADIATWSKKHLDRRTLKLEFAARRIVLDAADKQNVAIRDQDMLSAAARQVIPALQDIVQDGGVNAPCLICGCQGGDISQDLIKKAWDALNANKGGMDPKNFEKALACARVTIDKYAGDADEQQATRLQASECKKTPTREEREKDAYFASYWALSDISAAWWIRGQVLEQQRNCTEAKEAYRIIIAKYNCAYIWDPRGWFWNAAKGADQALKDLEKNGCTGTVR